MGEAALPVNVEVTQGRPGGGFFIFQQQGYGTVWPPGELPGDRALVDEGTGWQPADTVPAVIGFFFSTQPSEMFDRANNLVGVDH